MEALRRNAETTSLASPLAAQDERPICRPGETCWVRLPASRVAFLVDAQAYFGALHETLLAARERVWIVGWDVHARTPLRQAASPFPSERRAPDKLGPLLDFVARRNRRLRVHVLEWDYSLLFASERGLAPWVDLDWRTHPRVRFQLDAGHPVGACLHEKIVVIDDAVAFVGGLDLTLRRWDTPEHRADDPRRRDPTGAPYEPFHDAQMLVQGEVVRPIAERIRRRWNEVTADRVPRLPVRDRDVWPASVRPAVRDVTVAVARTDARAGFDGDASRLFALFALEREGLGEQVAMLRDGLEALEYCRTPRCFPA